MHIVRYTVGPRPFGPTENQTPQRTVHAISGTVPSRRHGTLLRFLAVLEVDESSRWPRNDVRGAWPIHTTGANT